MVREDGALAQRLQEEEFGNHYLRNRSERKTVREDVKAAKITYLEEVRSAQILPVAEVHNITIGVGFSSLCARVGGMAAPYIVDATGLAWVPPVVFGATSFFAGVIAMLLPETRGKPLPDFVAKESGGDGKGILSEQKQEFADYTSTV
ncbi:solute carrier family 22 member 15-like isoform X4 [Montipora capricornis]